jgi:uncharacterized membrane protein YuzA (DUF378 family)
MQTVIAILIGIAAFIYVLRIFIKQFSQSEKDPKCENCPVPDLKKSIKRDQ